ncbi:hypothetical protein Ahy_B02g058080 isoform A [Arachis hypogaea]|uniref:Secreted protein n=1 Tax=Arachis hypogaea TaxID=3818 RepID=A0A445ADS9_ARAHY|nr:hypothetical protein Ahy_B02g058080 isoform A [Arachis hypogaea]
MRYCMVLFAGIAAEALVYGEAEGRENDENLFRNICLLLEPPLSLAEVSPQCKIDAPVLMGCCSCQLVLLMPLCWTLYRMKECHAANK